jgi:hypothetical protein
MLRQPSMLRTEGIEHEALDPWLCSMIRGLQGLRVAVPSDTTRPELV